MTPQPPTLGTLYFVGNATTVISYGGLRLLTDPNFLHRGQLAYLDWGLVSRRLTEPALPIDELPPLTGVVLSHLHGDHWDRVARRRLARDIPILTTPHAARRLRKNGFADLRGLDSWQTSVLDDGTHQVRVTALPGKHGPGPVQVLLPPVMGSLLEFGRVGAEPDVRLYVTGDVLVTEDVHAIARRFRDIDLAVLHLGGTRIAGVTVTMDGRRGRELLQIVEPREAVPIHYDDYSVFRSPLADFRAEVAAAGLAERVRYVARGETLSFGPARAQD